MKTLLQITIIMLALSFFGLTVKSQNSRLRFKSGQTTNRETLDTLKLASELVQGMITVKLKAGTGVFGKQTGTVRFGIPSLDDKVVTFKVNQLEKRFRFNPSKLRDDLPDLSRIYKISFPDSIPLDEVVNAFLSDPNVEYAEAIPVIHAAEIPDDALYSQLQHLPQIFAPQAWAIHKGENGSDEIVIAINDTGVDWDHIDLRNNIWQNLAEDVDGDGHTMELSGLQWVLDPGDLNGIDDDGNDHVDDLIGWNFIGNNGDPNPYPNNPFAAHGTHCAGIAGGVTNNGTGIASISWNVKIMAICIDQNNTDPYAWDGMIYAAENGADIISNSWGWGFNYSNANQEVVNYAAGLGSIILAASHNQNISTIFVYPAAYQNVISVAAVNGDDTKTPYSNYNLAVDISAPGGGTEGGIISTIPGNDYAGMSGTSMATPMVAGCLGLLKSYHPDWSNDQLITQLLGTADNIDTLNPGYLNMLGSGRVNAFRMLTEENVMPFLKLDLVDVSPLDANGNGINEPGENVTLNFKIHNYMPCYGADNVNVSLTTEDPDITIINGTCSYNVPPDTSFSILDQLQIQVGANAGCHFAELTIHFQSDIEITAGQDINFKVLVNPSGIFVFEGEQNGQDYSGTFISRFLNHLGYNYTYSNTCTSLLGFETVFMSYGNFGQSLEQGTSFTENNAIALQQFLENGGNAYVEMGGMFYKMTDAQYPNRAIIKQLFGVNSFILSNLQNQIDTLRGVATAPTAGMLFAGSDQFYNWHIDRLTPINGAIIPFVEQGYGNVAVMNNAAATYGQKTFYMGYTLADLHDKDTTSSRNNVLLKTMDFFGYNRPQGYLLSNFVTDKKAGGLPLQIQFTDISLYDPSYPITSWQWDFENDGTIDSYDQNPLWTYNDVGIFDVRLVASNVLKSDTIIMQGLITINTGYLVYDGVAGGADFSGAFIRDYLQDHVYSVTYRNTLPESIKGFSAAFLSFGNFSSGSAVLDEKMANKLIEYLESGGYVYLEGSDALGYDQANNTLLLELFGLASAEDGETDLMDSLAGQPDALTNGMLFSGNSQVSNSYIDKYVPSANANAAFIESNYGTVAVQYSVPDAQRTFCFSYALAKLNDGEAPNTREELLNRILTFFNIYTDAPDGKITNTMKCNVYPNPMHTNATIQYFLPEDSQVMLEIFNSSGQKILQQIKGRQIKGEHSVQWNAEGLPAGFYYYSLKSGKQTDTGKLIIIK